MEREMSDTPRTEAIANRPTIGMEAYREMSEHARAMEGEINAALLVARQYSQIDGAHHKAWVIDRMVRALTGDGYEAWVREHKAGVHGPDTFEWDEGIPP
jgi:hypothetical protein